MALLGVILFNIMTNIISGTSIVGLFEYLSTLMLVCAQSGGVSGLEEKEQQEGAE